MPTMDGIDVSKYQNQAGAINWTKVAASGAKFCFVKMSGTTTADPFGKDNLKNARSKGLLVGGYHFMTNGASGKNQAKAFLSTVTLKPGDIRPVIDIETVPGNAASKKTYVQRCEEFLAEVTTALGGTRPFIYTRKDILSSLGNPASFKDCPLWLAQYTGPDTPTYGIPDPWRRLGKRWTMWQWVGDAGRVPGFATAVDRNWFDAPTVWRDGTGGVRAQWDSPGDGWMADESLSADDRMRAWLGLDTRDHHRPSSDGIVHGGAWVDDLIAQRKLMTDD